MISLAITNASSSVAINAGDGTLPTPLNWVTIAPSATVTVVVEASDMVGDSLRSGFSLGAQLQQLKQKGICTFTATAFGDTAANGSVSDGVIHNT